MSENEGAADQIAQKCLLRVGSSEPPTNGERIICDELRQIDLRIAAIERRFSAVDISIASLGESVDSINAHMETSLLKIGGRVDRNEQGIEDLRAAFSDELSKHRTSLSEMTDSVRSLAQGIDGLRSQQYEQGVTNNSMHTQLMQILQRYLVDAEELSSKVEATTKDLGTHKVSETTLTKMALAGWGVILTTVSLTLAIVTRPDVAREIVVRFHDWFHGVFHDL